MESNARLDTESFVSSEDIAEREALLNRWKHENKRSNDDDANPRVTVHREKPKRNFTIDFTKKEPHTTYVKGEEVDLPEGYLVPFTAEQKALKGFHLFKGSDNKAVDPRTFAKAFEGVFISRGIVPDIRITPEGVWVNSSTLDAMIEHGAYKMIDESNPDFQEGHHLFAENLADAEPASLNRLLSQVQSILERHGLSTTEAVRDENLGEEGIPKPIVGFHHEMTPPLVRLDSAAAARLVKTEFSPHRMMEELGENLHALTTRHSEIKR